MKNPLVLLMFIILISCKKDESVTYEIINSFSGKIENWNLGSDYKIIFRNNLIIDSTSIDSIGNFNLSKLSIPTNLVLIDSTSTLKVSNKNIKSTSASLFIYKSNDL
jgi:hypothetical protein